MSPDHTPTWLPPRLHHGRHISLNRRARAAASACLLVVALTHPAAAEPESVAPSPAPNEENTRTAKPRIERTWYGWQTLLLDGGALGAMGVALGVRNPSVASAFVGVSLTTYVAGPPFVHAFHGNPDTALKSGGMRLLLPPATAFGGMGVGALVGFWGGVALGSVWAGFQGLFLGAVVGSVGGFGVGYVGAVVIDAAKLSYEEAPVVDKQARVPTPAPWTLEPRVSLTPRGGAQLGIGGAF